MEFSKSALLFHVSEELKEKQRLTNIQFRCELGGLLPMDTPLWVFLTRQFLVHSVETSAFLIQGRMQNSREPAKSIADELVALELPAVNFR
jgi:hypothetical protein